MKKLHQNNDLVLKHHEGADGSGIEKGLYAFSCFGKNAKKDGKLFAKLLEYNACGDFCEALKKNLLNRN